MKKSLASKLAVFFVVCAVIFSCVAVSAFAADTTATLGLSSLLNESNEVEVVLTLSKGVKLSTIQAEINYDKDLVTYKGSEYLAGQQNATNGKVAGIVLINDIWKEAVDDTVDTDIVKLTFTVNEGVSAKDATFSLGKVTATDNSDATITFAKGSAESTKVVVTAKPTTTAPDGGNNGGGNANGNSPATAGTIAASLAGVAVAATAAAVAVIVIKKKNNAE